MPSEAERVAAARWGAIASIVRSATERDVQLSGDPQEVRYAIFEHLGIKDRLTWTACNRSSAAS